MAPGNQLSFVRCRCGKWYTYKTNIFIDNVNCQLIHGQGFNDDERADLVPFVHKNIFDAMDTFISQMSSLDVSFSDPLREEDVSLIQTEEEDLEKRLSAAQ